MLGGVADQVRAVIAVTRFTVHDGWMSPGDMLTKVDPMSMARGLGVRVPLLVNRPRDSRAALVGPYSMTFRTYAETHFRRIQEGRDFELTARGSGEWFHDCLPEERRAPMLDVGCGHGVFLRFFKLSGYQAIEGIEISEGQAVDARKRLSPHFSQGRLGAYRAGRGGSLSTFPLYRV